MCTALRKRLPGIFISAMLACSMLTGLPPRTAHASVDATLPNGTPSDPVLSYCPNSPGAQHTSEGTPLPAHAYSPFDAIDQTAAPAATDLVPDQVLVKFKAAAMQPASKGGTAQPDAETLRL